MPLSGIEEQLLGPLVGHVAECPTSLKQAALLCYGEDEAERGQSLLGSDALVAGTVERILSSINKRSGDQYVGKLSLVDLAGSERLSKSQVTGQAAKETMAINKSLSALGTVIASLATGEKHVPYRDSKLTYLLQDSLGGNSKTLMFVNCGPAQANCGETVNSLNFASRAKTVALGKATKNREEEAAPEKKGAGKASTVMAAANKLGNDEGKEDAPPQGSARGKAGDAGGEKKVKKLGAKAR